MKRIKLVNESLDDFIDDERDLIDVDNDIDVADEIEDEDTEPIVNSPDEKWFHDEDTETSEIDDVDDKEIQDVDFDEEDLETEFKSDITRIIDNELAAKEIDRVPLTLKLKGGMTVECIPMAKALSSGSYIFKDLSTDKMKKIHLNDIISIEDNSINEQYTLNRAIKDYSNEIKTLKKLKADGKKEVKASTWVLKYDKDDDKMISIDKAIELWEKDLKKLKSGKVDPEKYNY